MTFLTTATDRAGVDFAGTFAALDGLLYEHRLRAVPLASDLAVARGRLAIAIAAKAFEGERVARLVITHVRAAPLFEGLSLVGHPWSTWDVPLLVADVRVLPSGVTHAYLDACGPARGEFDALFRKPLSQTLDAAVASAVRRRRLPSWLDGLTAGAGAELAANRGRGHVLTHALVRYVERWLEGAARAKAAENADANAAAMRVVGDTMRRHGRGTKMLSRAFGADLAARHTALVWRSQ